MSLFVTADSHKWLSYTYSANSLDRLFLGIVCTHAPISFLCPPSLPSVACFFLVNLKKFFKRTSINKSNVDGPITNNRGREGRYKLFEFGKKSETRDGRYHVKIWLHLTNCVDNYRREVCRTFKLQPKKSQLLFVRPKPPASSGKWGQFIKGQPPLFLPPLPVPLAQTVRQKS